MSAVLQPKSMEAEDLKPLKVGQKVALTFGKSPCDLICVERVGNERDGLLLRFRAMVFGVEVAEVAAEFRADGSVVLEEL